MTIIFKHHFEFLQFCHNILTYQLMNKFNNYGLHFDHVNFEFTHK